MLFANDTHSKTNPIQKRTLENGYPHFFGVSIVGKLPPKKTAKPSQAGKNVKLPGLGNICTVFRWTFNSKFGMLDRLDAPAFQCA
jgi:hypothetical protein